jgi:hypothetical protein
MLEVIDCLDLIPRRQLPSLVRVSSIGQVSAVSAMDVRPHGAFDASFQRKSSAEGSVRLFRSQMTDQRFSGIHHDQSCLNSRLTPDFRVRIVGRKMIGCLYPCIGSIYSPQAHKSKMRQDQSLLNHKSWADMPIP